jgi:hypothetical protein
MMGKPTGRQKQCVNPEILRMFISTLHNISSNSGTEQLQRRILANLRRAVTHSNSNNIVSGNNHHGG